MKEVSQMTRDSETENSMSVTPEIGKWMALGSGMVKPNMSQRDLRSERCSRVGRNELS